MRGAVLVDQDAHVDRMLTAERSSDAPARSSAVRPGTGPNELPPLVLREISGQRMWASCRHGWLLLLVMSRTSPPAASTRVDSSLPSCGHVDAVWRKLCPGQVGR